MRTIRWLCLNRYDPGSAFGPWLRAMPTEFDLPFLWPRPEREALLSPALAADVAVDAAMVKSSHAKYIADLGFCKATGAVGAKICAFTTWQWAWVSSHAVCRCLYFMGLLLTECLCFARR